MTDGKKVFLTAHWSNLCMFNYEVPQEILQPFLPPFTQLDLYNGKALVSVVGFMFTNTKMLGIKWPWHVNFEEVNLRLYIKYYDGQQWKRGVAFVSEIVPKPAISIIANALYNEHYSYSKMKHSTIVKGDTIDISFSWRKKGVWNNMQLEASNLARPMPKNSEAEFILEHYWGYNALNKNTLIEYEVVHKPWEIYDVLSYNLEANIPLLYGKVFEPFIKNGLEHSVFIAKGSDVVIKKPKKIKQ